ncbi:MAG: 3'-5' exonuclease [Victivallales bacterium]
METDRAAVTIMTVHKSKGLEYPLVLLPTLFTWNAEKFAENYHLPDGSIERDFTGSAESEALASAERLQELLRLAYVAITRAKYYCHIYWGACRNRTSALDWLFRMRTLTSLPELKDMRNLLNSSQESALNAIPADWLAEPVPETEILPPYTVEQTEAETLNPPHWNGKIDYAWHITSYSGLTPHGGDAPSDYDSEDDEAPVERRMTGIFSIPGGAQTGNAWHEILEKLDFTDHERRLPGLIEEKLSLYGLLKNDARKEERIALTAEMIGKVLASPLTDAGRTKFHAFGNPARGQDQRNGIPLQVPQRLPRRSAPHGTGTVYRGKIRRGGMGLPARVHFRRIPERVHRPRIPPPRTFLHHRLEIQPSRRLSAELPAGWHPVRHAKHFHFLQYLIYSVALVKFLRLKNGSFTEQDHEKYFGGVYYLFLRGITPEAPGNGIYRDRPPFALLMQLEQLIG